MACFVHSSVFPQPLRSSAASLQAREAHCRASGGVASRRDAPVGGGGSWSAADTRPGCGLQSRATRAVAPHATSADSSGGGSSSVSGSGSGSGIGTSAQYRRGGPGGSQKSPVPDVDAAQLLRSLGLDATAQPAKLLANLRKLPGVRQQGVLDNAAAVAAHLLSPAVGLTRQQAGQLLERCPELFSWAPERRAALLFGELLGAGLTAAAVADCFAVHPAAAKSTTFAPGLAELAAILAHSRDREGGSGPKAAVPAAQRTVAALLSQTPSAVALVCQSAGYLQQRATELQQAGFSAADVAALAWERPELLWRDAAARVAAAAAVVQQELGLPAAEVVTLAARRRPSWLTLSTGTLRERAAALAEGFGRPAAAAMLLTNAVALGCDPAVWQRNLCYMAACGVADPTPLLRRCPHLLHFDHAAASFLQRRLLLQKVTQLTAAQLYEQHPHWLVRRQVPDLVQRLHFVEQRGRDTRQLLVTVLHQPLPQLLAALGASQAEWEAWAATNPPEACPLYRWAQQAAGEEAARLAAALLPELAQAERRAHPRVGRKCVAGK